MIGFRRWGWICLLSILVVFLPIGLLSHSLLCAEQLPFGISLPQSLNFATAPNPVGSGARAVGKGTAFIGVADDATAASHNPGGLVQLERPEVSVVGSYYVRREIQDVTRPDTVLQNQSLNNFDLNYFSLAYPFQLFQRNMTLSFNVQRLFDLQGKTDSSSLFSTLDGVQQVRSRQHGGLYTISPALAVQIIPALSFGAAFNFWTDSFGNNGWQQDVTVSSSGRVVAGNTIVPFVSEGHIREEYNIEGFNITMGFLWKINKTFSLGGVFRSPFKADLTHRHSSSLDVTLLGNAPQTVNTNLNFTETLSLKMPMVYGLGLSARLSDRFILSGDVSRAHWSDFSLQPSTRTDVLLIENGAPAGKGKAVLHGESDDTTSFRLGMEYLWIRPKVVIPLRSGLFYDPEPGEGRPDNFFGFSLGTGLSFKKIILDLAYEFRAGTVKSTATDTSIQQHKVLMSMIYHF